ncbi:hypothetical protein NDU88_005563 [Pleurodeles waltl]|uniref:Secreted protein n=1 Tax=Pleurodeles waltl TaxID=8319 RepID=A0AAV7PNY6_PLEWA|nr:hypothetical protein NDU88_005563 [Pleurodeles waltl]
MNHLSVLVVITLALRSPTQDTTLATKVGNAYLHGEKRAFGAVAAHGALYFGPKLCRAGIEDPVVLLRLPCLNAGKPPFLKKGLPDCRLQTTDEPSPLQAPNSIPTCLLDS